MLTAQPSSFLRKNFIYSFKRSTARLARHANADAWYAAAVNPKHVAATVRTSVAYHAAHDAYAASAVASDVAASDAYTASMAATCAATATAGDRRDGLR